MKTPTFYKMLNFSPLRKKKKKMGEGEERVSGNYKKRKATLTILL